MTSRSHMLRVRFSDDEWEKLQQLAERADMTMSELVRDHLGRLSVRNRQDEKQRIVLLNRINANLNMIARWVNTHKRAADAVQVVARLVAIQRVIKKISQ